MIEPLYDTYAPVVRMLGAVPRFVPTVAADLGPAARRAGRRVGPATKAILLNSPMNPCGKVFTAAELGDEARYRRR